LRASWSCDKLTETALGLVMSQCIIDKIIEENPDLSLQIIREILVAKAEIEAGEVSEYKFSDLKE
jgi:hypothetical protein